MPTLLDGILLGPGGFGNPGRRGPGASPGGPPWAGTDPREPAISVVEVVGSSVGTTYVNVDTGGNATRTLTKPTRAQAGDWVFILASGNLAGPPTLDVIPTGFAKMTGGVGVSTQLLDGTNTYLDVLGRYIPDAATAAGISGETWTVTYSSTSKGAYPVVVVRGLDPSNPFDVAPVGTTEAATPTSHTTGAVTPASANTRILTTFVDRLTGLLSQTGSADPALFSCDTTGSNAIHQIVTLSDEVPAGVAQSRTVRLGAASGAAVMWIAALRPGTPATQVADSDTAAAVDAVSALVVSLTDSDTATATDTVTLLDTGSTAKSDADTAAAVDAVTALAVAATAADTASAADAATALTRTGPADTAAGTDAATALVVQLTASDTAAAADAVSALTAAVTATETGAGTDAAAALARAGVADTAAATDAVTTLAVASSSSDTASGAEAVTAFTRDGVSDAGTAVDAVQTLDTGAVAKSDSDTAAAVDAVTALTVASSSGDTAAGADAVSAFARTGVADTGAATDAAGALVVTLTATETGAAADAAATLARTGPADSGAGVDAATALVVQLTASDTATATDAVSSLAQAKTGSDTAAGVDVVTALVVQLFASDTAAAVDVVTVLVAPPSGPVREVGSWWSLAPYAQERRAAARAGLLEHREHRCPDCGDLLVAGPDGVLFCNTDHAPPVRRLVRRSLDEPLVACPDDGEPLVPYAGRLRCPFCGHAW